MFIAGGLGNGGAEKQLLYILRTLRKMGADMRVLTLTRGEFHEETLRSLGIPFTAVDASSPPARLALIVQAAREFRPHFIQATHFFASFYAGLAGRLVGIPSIGAIRGDLYHDLSGIGKGAAALLRLPTVLLANSYNAQENAIRLGIAKNRVYVLPNVIDLNEFDRRMSALPLKLLSPDPVRVVTVARLIPVKRLERFMNALSLARLLVPEMQGILVGSGPEKDRLFALAEALGLHPDQPSGGVQFLGDQPEIPQILAQSDLFVLTSDREGFPNVILEAMAASLPVITTPAGECRVLVKEGRNGYQVSFDDQQLLADRLVTLARSPALRRKFGNEARRMVESFFGFEQLGSSLVDVYRAIATQVKSEAVLAALSNGRGVTQGKTSSYFEKGIVSRESQS